AARDAGARARRGPPRRRRVSVNAGVARGLHPDRDPADRPRLRRVRARVARDPDRERGLEFNLRVFVSAMGTDRGETFFGIPAFPAPVVNLGIPEIAIFKWVRNRGLAEVSLFAFGQTGAFVIKRLPEIGRSKQDDFAV